MASTFFEALESRRFLSASLGAPAVPAHASTPPPVDVPPTVDPDNVQAGPDGENVDGGPQDGAPDTGTPDTGTPGGETGDLPGGVNNVQNGA